MNRFYQSNWYFDLNQKPQNKKIKIAKEIGRFRIQDWSFTCDEQDIF